MRREPLPSTLEPFDWNVLKSGTDRYWALCWALLKEQTARLAAEGIVDRGREVGDRKRKWTPAVDLALREPSMLTWFEKGKYVPARDVLSIATARVPGRLVRGTVLYLESSQHDNTEHMGTNFWSIEEGDIDVAFIHSALGGRWGGAACLADELIVRIDHPIVGDSERANRLVVDLQDVTRAFRVANGLPAEGEHEPKADATPAGT